MYKNLTPSTLHLLTRKELPYSLEFLSYHKFEAKETTDKSKLDNLLYIEFEKKCNDLSIVVTYTFDLDSYTVEELCEKSVELKINDEYTSLDFQNKLDLYNLVYALEKGTSKQVQA